METVDSIRQMIYEVRGVKVMLDADLAALYGYTTKAFNQQVKNNIAKFDADFRFQLTREEYHEILMSKKLNTRLVISSSEAEQNDTDIILRSKKLTLDDDIICLESEDNKKQDFLRSNFLTSKIETRGGRQYFPYVFTEQGIYMLMTVLKGDLALHQNPELSLPN